MGITASDITLVHRLIGQRGTSLVGFPARPSVSKRIERGDGGRAL